MLQQNRKFVFVLVMSEITARLYQFDRTGLQQFRKFNYHKSALDFLRLVIGLLAADDEACGFDTSIFWKGDRRYIRNVHDKNGPFEYQLTSVNSSAEFTGIGTVRWLAQDVHGTSLIIEDTWPFADQESRDRLLDLIRGLDGVGEVLACEESFNTSQFREPGAADTSPIPPRVRCRIIFKEYKNSIDKFENRVEFLQALGDAVVGHRNLWKRGVLHRDISIDNIRIGRDGARTGNIGLLIGILHSSFVFEGSKKLELTDHRTSESRFQSILVASSCPTFEDYIPYNYAYESAPHDYLDDLESFFYVFVWICLGYEGPGRPHPPSLKRFSTWDEQGIFSAHAKRWLLSERTDGDWKVSPYFGPVFQALFRELRIFIGERLNTKMKAIRLFEWPRKPSDFQHVDDDYAMFLGFIDKALKGLQVEVLGEQRTSVISRFHFLPPQYAPPMAQVVRERNKRSHPNSKQPSDENVKAGMLSTGKQPLKHSQTEMRYDISHRNPPCWPLGTLR
ncbi:hypothetical protein M413DRAFT_416122 [Hebeloma cylindrosporum]|uniref:Fungal-type protein kinase domain-containing protein n=1 Tax=Hebeloma cylindrosporum TaxID=76867 RepID=A0A0C3CF87_HEBCY|nr:hypothetical protein M413DRAFT_416122 [Hebeloma cylindrosporum h7]